MPAREPHGVTMPSDTASAGGDASRRRVTRKIVVALGLVLVVQALCLTVSLTVRGRQAYLCWSDR
jgi:hypothetical protein